MVFHIVSSQFAIEEYQIRSFLDMYFSIFRLDRTRTTFSRHSFSIKMNVLITLARVNKSIVRS